MRAVGPEKIAIVRRELLAGKVQAEVARLAGVSIGFVAGYTARHRKELEAEGYPTVEQLVRRGAVARHAAPPVPREPKPRRADVAGTARDTGAHGLRLVLRVDVDLWSWLESAADRCGQDVGELAQSMLAEIVRDDRAMEAREARR